MGDEKKRRWSRQHPTPRRDPNFPPTFTVWEEVMHPWLGVATATEHFPQGRPLTS
jgi:hypothetical protein